MTGQQYPTREQIAARLTGDIFDAVPDDNDMQHVLTLAAAILSQPTPSAEATVLVPVSLIERAAELLDKHHPGITSARLRAVLFPQPTPSAEPLTSEQASEQMHLHMVRNTPPAECGMVMPHDPHLWATEATMIPWESRRCSGAGTEQGHRMAAHEAAAPPSITDMAPGCGS